jgi:hypothetical protein
MLTRKVASKSPILAALLAISMAFACDSGDSGNPSGDGDDDDSSEGGDESTPGDTTTTDPTTDPTTSTDTTTSSGDGEDCADAESTGANVGDIVPDISLLGDDEAQHTLREVCDNYVYLVSGTMWCPTCKAHAKGFAAIKTKFEGKNLVIYNLMSEAEDGGGAVPSVEDLQSWAAAQGFVEGIFALSDAGGDAFRLLFPESSSYMGEMLIAPGGEILCTGLEAGCADKLDEVLGK